MLGLKTVDLPRLRNWSDLRFAPVPGLSRTLGQYDADQIDDLAALLRSSDTVESAAWSLDLPVYGAEQLVAAGLLKHRDHGAFDALGRDRQVSTSSIGELQQRIRSALRTGSPPAYPMPLRLAMRNFGGGPKPWADIVSAILRGDIHAWASSERVGLQSLVVDGAASAGMIDRLSRTELVCKSLIPSAKISKIDAAELFNLDQKSVGVAASDLGITFSRHGRALAARLSEVHSAARRIVWESELRRRLDCNNAELRLIMDRLRLPRLAQGWYRRDAVLAGLPATITASTCSDEAPIGSFP